ncbi:methylsterol monooxygenase [Starmerella bacillaris]|uniref:Methylsterol monooxygenase n=1 Tax=Starmerella bacillaris TaxID=1247836 RepID=A0AAV5RMH4_STABA|nr:methylsterol monooxygenase [Starmerella bacillaris]
MSVNATAQKVAEAIIPPHLNWLEQKWNGWYDYMNNDTLATGILLLVLHEGIYFGRSLPWLILDAMPSMRKYKIQDNRPPTRAEYIECLKSVITAHTFVEAVPIFGFHFVCELFNIAYRAPFPSAWTVIWQLAALFLMEDTWHYWGHRALHSKLLYKPVHKMHHKYAAPFGLTAEYAHPIEVAFTGTGTVGSPLLLAYLTGDMHLFTVAIWISLRLIQAVDSHSGYDFPWSLCHWFPMWAGADHHDDHHHYFVGNFASSFRHWDYFLGTETPATTRRRDTGKFTAEERHEIVEDPDDIADRAKTSGVSGKTTTARRVKA